MLICFTQPNFLDLSCCRVPQKRVMPVAGGKTFPDHVTADNIENPQSPISRCLSAGSIFSYVDFFTSFI